jgi:hypothetical protein
MATVVFASSVGTIIEWYDFFIYGTAAAIVFNTLFFPNIDPLAGTLASLATFSVGFIARPIGGAIFGHFGHRRGRKIMLMITMVIMALGTFAIGSLPTYQQIGIWAPILLVILRFIQGIGIGGEWGGASLMVIEHAPTWPVRQLSTDRGAARAGYVFGRVRSGDDDAGCGFQDMGMARSLPAQYPATWRRLRDVSSRRTLPTDSARRFSSAAASAFFRQKKTPLAAGPSLGGNVPKEGTICASHKLMAE